MAPLSIVFAYIVQEAFFIGSDRRRLIRATPVYGLGQTSSVCSLHVVATIHSIRSWYRLHKGSV